MSWFDLQQTQSNGCDLRQMQNQSFCRQRQNNGFHIRQMQSHGFCRHSNGLERYVMIWVSDKHKKSLKNPKGVTRSCN